MNDTFTPLILTVTKIRQLTPHIRAYELADKNTNNELPLMTAGSKITFPITLDNGKNVSACYPVFSNPNQRNLYEIAVESSRDEVSRYVIDNFIEGTQIKFDSFVNHFHLHADASPSLLIAGELGIATLLPIAHTLASRGRRFALHYLGEHNNDMAFVNELPKLFPRTVTIYSNDQTENFDLLYIMSDTPANSLIYACGPKKLLDEIIVNARLLGISQDRIQCEYFVADKIAKDNPIVLELAYSDKLIQVSAEQSLLNAIRSANVDIHFDCCVGDCGTCATKILEGEADHRDHVLTDEQKSEGFICVCVSRAKSEKLLLAL